MTDSHIWEKAYPEGVNWHDPIDARPVHRILENTAGRFGPRPAIDFLGKTYSYRELNTLVSKTARGLQNIGVAKGKKIGLFLPNSPYAVIFYFAILKTGATVVNYNPLYAERELKHQIEDSETDILVTMDLKLLYDKAAIMLHETRVDQLILCKMSAILPFPKNILFPIVKHKDVAKIEKDKRHIRFENLIENDGHPEYVEIDPAEDIAVLQYTGGTTGVPKGAMLTHQNIYANAQQAAKWLSIVKPGEESQLAVLPFFHVFAMTAVMNLSIWHGLQMILLPRFELKQVLQVIDKKKPQYFPAVPAIYNAINAAPETKNYDLSSIRFCLSGGAPLPVDTKTAFEARTGCIVGEGYGLTESSPVLTCNPVSGGDIRTGSIGLPLPGTVIEIVSLEDGETIMPQGEKGEICGRGPQVMKGYYNRPEATADTIRNGRLHTGDVGYMDEDGYTYIVDRIKDLILVRGYNVYPRNIEEGIYLHPSVEECIVAGVPDAERGETVWAWIKPVSGKSLEESDLRGFLEDKISPIEMPRKFIIRDQDLPKTAVGKLSRKDLLEQEGIKKSS